MSVTLEGSNLSLAAGDQRALELCSLCSAKNPWFRSAENARTVKRSHINISVLDAVAPLHGAMLQLPSKPGVFDTPANDEYDPVGVGPHTNSRSTLKKTEKITQKYRILQTTKQRPCGAYILHDRMVIASRQLHISAFIFQPEICNH